MLSERSDSDKSLELAYTAAQDMLKEQVGTLARLRARANDLLSTAALFISFSAGVGLINNDPGKGTVFRSGVAVVLLLAVVALGAKRVVRLVAGDGLVLVPIGVGDAGDGRRRPERSGYSQALYRRNG